MAVGLADAGRGPIHRTVRNPPAAHPGDLHRIPGKIDGV